MFNGGGSSVALSFLIQAVMQSKVLQNVAITGSHVQFYLGTMLVAQPPGSFGAQLRSKLCFAIVLCGNAIGN